MDFPKTYDPKESEEKIYKLWEKSGFFNPDKLPKEHKKPYTIVVPPPNVTGELHMGHALNATIQDTLIRWKRMKGFKTLWLPGTDHAGIATQNVVEKKLKKEGKTRFDLGRSNFVKEVWKWKEKYGDIILNQFKRMGSSLDWSRTTFTMDQNYAEAVKTAFSNYYKKGWIYKGKRVINWCPRCQTSLSDLEVERKEKETNLWYIKYPIAGEPGSITVATTRPETMLGDTAVAVNPKDKRHKKLIGKKAVLPLVNKEIPIIADRLIDTEFGTGAVKVTPAHSFVDFEIAQKHKLEIIQVINEKGEITESAPLPYQGMKTKEAREKVVEDLEKNNFLEKTEKHVHQTPRCERCGSLVELLPSEQWFLKMDELAKKAKKQVKEGKIKFTPKRWEKVYFNWLDNIRDWCISRQLWWGHKLPVWECQNKKGKYFLSEKEPKKCLVCGKCNPKQTTDVLDTWFSSALWPFATLGWPKKTKDLKTFYPTNTLSTDRGIINLWVARMIFSSMEFMKKIPFDKVYIHATVLTKDGRRMSKSLGTGINPMTLIEKYGADATRFGLSYQITELQDMKFSEDNIIMGKKFCNKIWNASRFVLQQIPESKFSVKNLKPKEIKNKSNKKTIKSLEKIINTVDKDIEKFQLGKACHSLYDFFWHNFCDKCIEEAKERKEDEETQRVLLYTLLTCLKILHPFIPFLTESIYQNLPLKDKKKCLMVEKWPS
jgi:valyl-tRNA synthetase